MNMNGLTKTGNLYKKIYEGNKTKFEIRYTISPFNMSISLICLHTKYYYHEIISYYSCTPTSGYKSLVLHIYIYNLYTQYNVFYTHTSGSVYFSHCILENQLLYFLEISVSSFNEPF